MYVYSWRQRLLGFAERGAVIAAVVRKRIYSWWYPVT